MADMDGRALKLHPLRAGVQHRDRAGFLLKASRPCLLFIERLSADGG
jgi:hypothetical protein